MRHTRTQHLLLAILLVLAIACTSPAPTSEPVTITFVALSFNWGHYQTLAEAFNVRHPTIHVQVRDPDDFLSPGDDLSFENAMRLLASSADVFLAYELDPATLKAGGAVYDLQPLLERHPEFVADDFFPGLLTRFAEEEVLWGIPAGVEPLVMHYNRVLFDAAGVDYPQPGWTWDDFLTTALALTDRDAEIWGFTEQWRYGSVGAFVYQHGGTLTTDGGPDFDNPLAVEALDWYADLVRTHHVMPGPDSSDSPRPKGNKLPQTGRAAMWIGGLGQNRSTNTGVIPLPCDRQDVAMEMVLACYISAGTAHPEAAWQWIDFLTHQLPEFGLLPARRSVLASPAYRSKVDDEAYAAYSYILEHLPESPWPARYPWFAAAYRWLAEEGLPAMMRGESDAESVLAEAQSRALAAQAESAGTDHAGPVIVAQPTTASADTIVLTFLQGRPVGGEFDELARLYQAERPGVTVKVTEFLSGVEYPPERLATAADVFPVFPGFELGAVEEHWLNLQPLVEGDPTAAPDDFYPQALEAYRRRGDLWGLPTEIDADMLFYNKALFDTAGLAYPCPDWTWDDFLTAAARLTRGEGADKQWGFITLTNGWETLPLILAAQQGGCLVDSRAAPILPTLDDPAVVDAVRWYADLERSHGVMPPPAVHFADWQTIEALISQGQAAMWISAVGARYWTRMSIELGVVPLPVSSGGGQPATMYDIIGYGLSAQTAYPQESWRWLTFLMRQSAAMRGLPARRSLADQATFPFLPSELRAEVLQAYQLTLDGYADAGYAGVWAHAPWFDVVYRLYRHAVKQTLEEGTDPAETLSMAQAIAEAYMACLEAHGGLTDESIGTACEEETGVPAPVLWYEE